MSRKYVLGPHAARELKRLIAGTGVAERRDTVSGAIAFDSEYADPFTVQWAASANSGSGSFIIWLPSASLLIVDGKPVDLTEDLTAVGGSYPAGWYETPLSSSGGSLYLNVTPGNPESTGEEDATAEFSTSESQTEGDVSILIATAAKDALTGAVTVKQSVSSALVFGTGKGKEVEVDDISVSYTGDDDTSGDGEGGDTSGEGASSGGGESGDTSGDGASSGGGESGGTSGDGDDESTDEGKKLQIKDWDNAGSNDSNNLATLMSPVDGQAHSENGDYELVARKTDGEEKVLKYLPLGLLGTVLEKVEASSVGGNVEITFTYTNGTTAKVVVPRGTNGAQGPQGPKGDSPEITSEKVETTTHIYADGEHIADIEDGHSPEITASKDGNTVTRDADGVAIVSWDIGSSGGGEEMAWESISAITDISFKVESGKLKAVLTKTSFYVPNTFELHPVEVVPTTEVDVCSVEDLDVVTSESYSTSTHAFTNTRKRIKVLGSQNATGQTPFTATPLSGE